MTVGEIIIYHNVFVFLSISQTLYYALHLHVKLWVFVTIFFWLGARSLAAKQVPNAGRDQNPLTRANPRLDLKQNPRILQLRGALGYDLV
jgi:hypothetical protein